jgi:hypothetical protein
MRGRDVKAETEFQAQKLALDPERSEGEGFKVPELFVQRL